MLRIIGIVLVLVGALTLGRQGFAHLNGGGGRDARPPAQAARDKDLGVPPVAGGIALVSGLILLVSSGRRSEAV